MPVVQLPDGREVDFPDGMSNDDIGSAIQRNFPEFAPKPSGVLGALSNARKAIREFAGTTPEQVAADKANSRDHAGVMSGMDGAAMPDKPVTAAAASVPPAAAGPLDLLAPLYDQQQNATAPAYDHGQELRDMLDRSAEARARRLVRQGMNVDQAKAVGQQAAARGVLPGMEGGVSTAGHTDVDFDAQKKFNDDPFFSHPVVRAAVKGYEGYKQGLLGLNQFIAERVGADDVASGQANMGKRSRATTDAMGEAHDPLQRNFEDAVSSIAQQLPAMIGGAATGSEPLVLGSMFAQSFGQEYATGRAQGQDQNNAAVRAGLFGAFEVVGEKLGLGERLALLRNGARGVETNALAKWMANTLTKELPGEMATTTGQFGTDKLGGGVGLHNEAGLADYLGQMGDTITQTVMQGAIMGGATGGVSAARNHLSGAFDTGAARDADAARRDAMNRWNTNGLSPRAGVPITATAPATPAGRVEPTWGDVAHPAEPVATIADIGAAGSVDDAIAAAQAVVNAPTATAHATAADIDALEQAASIAAQAPNLEQSIQEITHDAGTESAPAPASLGGTGDPTAVQPGETVDERPAPAGSGTERAPALDAVPGPAGGNDRVRAGAAGESSDAIGGGWHAFPPESGTLGIPRADMPQIAAEHRGAMVNFLNARGISHEQTELPADSLKPTQAEFHLDKVQKAHDFSGDGRSILVSSDGHVLDGHHQWLASMEKGEPVKAIRLQAPIRDLLDTVKEFPSATVSEGAPAVEAKAAPAAPKSSGAARARERLARDNPFLSFLAKTGIATADKKDSGIDRRAGNVMVPGHGPVFKKSGLRLDELALAARDAGFLTGHDIEHPDDTGGTRKLADMIGRALGQKEVIKPLGALHEPSVDEQLHAEAQKLGIQTEGKSADQLYDEVVAAHDDQFSHSEAQALVDAAHEADIDLDAGVHSNLETNEELDAVFGPQSRRAEAGTGQAQESAAAHAGGRTEETGATGQGEDLLSAYSRDDVLAREAKTDVAAKARATERERLEAQRKKDADDKDVRARMDASADDFQLGQEAHDSLAGQKDIFSEPAPAEPAVPKAADPLDGIPRTFLKKTSVEHQTYNAEAKRWETAHVPADQALRAVRDDISNLEAMLKCMKG